MTFRRPLVEDNGHLREMSTRELNFNLNLVARLFYDNPSVYLRTVSFNGNLGTIQDTRNIAGQAEYTNTSFPSKNNTDPAGTTQTNYSRLDEVVESVSNPSDSNNVQYPAYLSKVLNYVDDQDAIVQSEVETQSMTSDDFFDTFIKDIVAYLGREQVQYFLGTVPNASGWDQVGLVFTDTVQDLSAYTVEGIPETRDQPILTGNYQLARDQFGLPPGWGNFYLLRRDLDALLDTSVIKTPVKHTTDGNYQSYSLSEWESLLQSYIRYAVASKSGYRIRFNWNGQGTNIGSVFDLRFDGLDTKFEDQDGDRYYSQRIIVGPGQFVFNTYTLRMRTGI